MAAVYERSGEELGVAEGVGYAVCGERVAVVARVADERPSVAERLAHVTRDTREAAVAPDRRAALEARREVRCGR
ncbi:MAG: hypothetical protein ACRD07_22965, partial [Acidimicrobiales bacterium]